MKRKVESRAMKEWDKNGPMRGLPRKKQANLVCKLHW